MALLQPLNGLVFVGDGIYMGAEAFPYLAKAINWDGPRRRHGAFARGADGGLGGVWCGVTTLMVGRLLTLTVPYLRGRLFRDEFDSDAHR